MPKEFLFEVSNKVQRKNEVERAQNQEVQCNCAEGICKNI